jgi:hypothetical protein
MTTRVMLSTICPRCDGPKDLGASICAECMALADADADRTETEGQRTILSSKTGWDWRFFVSIATRESVLGGEPYPYGKGQFPDCFLTSKPVREIIRPHRQQKLKGEGPKNKLT